MKYLSAASTEVNALLTLLKVTSQNGDKVRTEMVNKTYRNIAKIYANNASRTPQASEANLDALLQALNVQVLKSALKAAEVNANRLADAYALTAKAAMQTVNESVGGGGADEVELMIDAEESTPEAE